MPRTRSTRSTGRGDRNGDETAFRRRGAGAACTTGAPGAQRRRTDGAHPAAARVRVPDGLGRGRAVELPALEHRTSLLHAEGRRRADPGRDVPVGIPLSPVRARRWPAGRRPGAHQRVRTEGRVPARGGAPGAVRPRRPPVGVRPAPPAPGARRPVRRGTQAPAPYATAQDRHRHLAGRRRAPRRPERARPPVPERASHHQPDACPGRRGRPGDRRRTRAHRRRRRRRRRDPDARRRIHRRPLGVQRRNAGPHHCRPRRPGDLGSGASDGLHDQRLRRRSAGADPVGGGRAGRGAEIGAGGAPRTHRRSSRRGPRARASTAAGRSSRRHGTGRAWPRFRRGSPCTDAAWTS